MQAKHVPKHLRKYTVPQNYDHYTPINQAVWRYVMRQNHHQLKETAHSAYIEGLKASGISIERLPDVAEMDECLTPYGWGAVTIDGFIPGVAFFDFQANGILPIAAEIRKLENIQYTPAPDIIHEAAGHAPILLDKKYSEYVKLFGSIGRKAIASKEEHDLFDAIRSYSNLLEKGTSTEEEIEAAKENLDALAAAVKGVSEAEQISRLYWWTVEYGLIGDVTSPKIYGAGLLSSVSEGRNALSDDVEKLPFDLDTMIKTGFDITKPQPQLFVCKNFEQLIEGVTEFSKRMAFMKGGTESLEKAKQSANVATVEYSSGLQVTGVLADMLYNDNGEAIYLKLAGPTALAFNNKEILGHGTETHHHGFSSPIGKLAGIEKPLELFSADELADVGVVKGRECKLCFESGVIVKGVVEAILQQDGLIQLISFADCSVTLDDEVLFETEWGTFDMAVGATIPSVYGGAADGEAYYPSEGADDREKSLPSSKLTELETLYARVRLIRESKQKAFAEIKEIVEELDQKYPSDWLLRLEIVELLSVTGWLPELEQKIRLDLARLTETSAEMHSLIHRGLQIS